MSCRYCGADITPRFGHLKAHEARCHMRPAEPTFKLNEESHEDEAPRFRNAHPRVCLGSGVTVWRRNG